MECNLGGNGWSQVPEGKIGFNGLAVVFVWEYPEHFLQDGQIYKVGIFNCCSLKGGKNITYFKSPDS